LQGIGRVAAVLDDEYPCHGLAPGTEAAVAERRRWNSRQARREPAIPRSHLTASANVKSIQFDQG